MLFRSPGEVAGLDGVRLAGRGALLTDQYHLGAGRDVQARLDHAVIAQRDADPGLRAEQGATADAHPVGAAAGQRSEEHTSELQSRGHLVCRLLLEKKKIMLSLSVSILFYSG